MQLFSRLMPREGRFFDLFNQHAALLVQGGTVLAELLEDYANVPARAARIKRIGELERAADRVTHDTVQLLHKTFVTPFDRDDIHRMISRMDDILDLMEDAAESLLLYDIQAVEPEASPVITQAKNYEKLQPGKHKIQGIGAGFIPENLNLDIVDKVERISDDDAFAWARRAAREEGILCGISSGAALCAANRVANDPENQGKTIVVILASAGERYVSSPLFEGTE